jgi:PAS domain S-box-containing protein
MPDSKKYEFTALFNNAAIGIIIVNNEGTILLVNQFAQAQFGYTLDELVGKKIEILIPHRYRERHIHYRDDYHQHNPHSRPMGTGMDLFAVKKDGSEFPVEVSLSTYRNDEGQFSIAFVSDITIRKQSEQALVQLNAELEEKVKERTQSLEEALATERELNELKSRFVSMASHEFRTPLSTILSSIYLVSQYQKAEEQPKREKHVQRIISSVNGLNDILNDFLSVGRIEENKIQVRIQDMDLPQTIQGLIAELNSILKAGQSIRYHHEGEHNVRFDPSLLRHMLMNLVSNAIKFSKEQDTILVETNLSATKLSLEVTDQGIGIADEDQPYLFQRFFRGANVSTIQGTGLGLHIVSKYAELLNGTISFESKLNKGTTFILTFDLIKETAN